MEAVEHLGQKVVELEVRKRGVGDALEASGDPGRLTRVVEQVGTVEGERHPAGDVLGDGELPGAERRALVAAGEQHHSERSSARCQRHEHRRPHVELLHDVDVLGALKQVVQHLLCEVRDHLRLTIVQHPDAAGTFFHGKHQLILVERKFEQGESNPGIIRLGFSNAVTRNASPTGFPLVESKRIPHTLKEPFGAETK